MLSALSLREARFLTIRRYKFYTGKIPILVGQSMDGNIAANFAGNNFHC